MTNNAVSMIAATQPTKAELEAGNDYFWCRCGRSKSQPFCDGSHTRLDGADAGDPTP